MSLNNSGGKKRTFIVCSCPLNPILQKLPTISRTWVNAFLKIPVHTFVVDETTLPLVENETDGYWYCAGDFKDIDENGVKQTLVEINPEYARCLVAPDLKLADPLHEKLVIGGQYNVNYVCHNIANRVLYAAQPAITLADLDIDIPGYSIVVKSTLGVYGQNQYEWKCRVERCSEAKMKDQAIRDRKTEIEKLHLKAVDGDAVKAKLISEKLKHVDANFLYETSKYHKVVEYVLNGYFTSDSLLAVYLYQIGIKLHEAPDTMTARKPGPINLNTGTIQLMRRGAVWLKLQNFRDREFSIKIDKTLFDHAKRAESKDSVLLVTSLILMVMYGRPENEENFNPGFEYRVLNPDIFGEPDNLTLVDFEKAAEYYNMVVANFAVQESKLNDDMGNPIYVGYHSLLYYSTFNLLYFTVLIVGLEVAGRIYPGCDFSSSRRTLNAIQRLKPTPNN